MKSVWESLGKAFSKLISPKVIVILFLPAILAFTFWMVVGFFSWGALTGFFAHWSSKMFFIDWFQNFVGQWFEVASVMAIVGSVLVIMLFLPVMYVTALIMVSLFITPYFKKWIIPQEFQQLSPIQEISFLRSLGFTFKYSSIFIFLLIFSLPLWLIPGAGMVIPFFLGAWLNVKLFLFESLQGYATSEEINNIQEKFSKEFMVLGIVLMMLNYIPFGFFITPVLTSLAFIYLSCQKLLQLRRL